MTKGKIFLALLVVILVAVPFAVFTQAESGIKSAAESYGPEVLGASVHLEAVSISPIAGEASLRGLTIGNPRGFDSPHAFSLGEIKIALTPMSLFTDHVRIQEILIDQPDIIWEVSGGNTNIQALQANINSALGEGQDAEANAGPTVSIDRLILRNARVSIEGLPIKQQAELSLPEIRLTDLGSGENGISPTQVGKELFDALAPAIARELAGSQLDGLAADLKDQGEEAAENLQEKAKDAVKDKLGGLLGKKKKDEEE